eukprot:1330038-Pleurochrysis_carterae.AAC.2
MIIYIFDKYEQNGNPNKTAHTVYDNIVWGEDLRTRAQEAQYYMITFVITEAGPSNPDEAQELNSKRKTTILVEISECEGA